MSTISTHILDTSLGLPAKDVAVILEQQAGASWSEIGQGTTNADGRITAFPPNTTPLAPGIYRLRFLVGSYFTARQVKSFYPEIPVTFHIEDPAAHYHVPLLLNPFGYSTYRGS